MTVRRTPLLLAVAALAALVLCVGPAHAITPANGGDAGGTATTINAGPGDQSEPKVGGDLAVYTDRGTSFTPGAIHYYDFLTGVDSVVPGGAPGDSDTLSDVNGSRIAFSRTRAADSSTAIMLFDTTSGAVTELDPGAGTMRFGAAIGGDTVAYAEFAFGGGDIFAHDLATGTATNLSQSFDADDLNPAVSPAGELVVWERWVGSNSDIYGSVRTAGIWGAATLVAATSATESNPDTDGATIVYDSERPSATNQDVYFRPVAGGPEIELELAGLQRNPSISNGVISFESKNTSATPADLFAYVIATNTLFRVTNTPTVDETLNDMSVLPNGTARVVWGSDDDVEPGLHNVYARTFTLPAAGDTTPPVLTLPGNMTLDAMSPAGAAVSFVATATDDVDGSLPVACSPSSGATFAIGTTTVSCTATDQAGNVGSGSFTVTVLGAKEQLNRLIAKVVNASGLPPALKTQLIARLQALVAGFDPTNPAQKAAVCLALNVFKGVVQALSGRGIPPAQASEWIADANRIRAVLAC